MWLDVTPKLNHTLLKLWYRIFMGFIEYKQNIMNLRKQIEPKQSIGMKLD